MGAIGHDFYEGERDGPARFPALHRPPPARPGGLRRLRAHGGGAQPRALRRGLLRRAAAAQPGPPRLRVARRSGRRCGPCATRASRARSGLAPGPANGFTLDTIGCFERYGELIDWAMLILNPFEPWPGELALAAAARHDVRVITRVVDYGGLFHDDVLPGHELRPGDHRGFRPGGLGGGGPRAARPHPADRRTPRADDAPAGLRLEPLPRRGGVRGPHADPGAGTRRQADRGASAPSWPPCRPCRRCSAEEVDAIRAVGDNTGSMLLKGATPDHEGDERPDRWTLEPEHVEIARRWGIEPERDLRRPSTPVASGTSSSLQRWRASVSSGRALSRQSA